DVLEGRVAAVVVEGVGDALVRLRSAVVAAAVRLRAVLGGIEADVVADVDVEEPVEVVVEEADGGGPGVAADPGTRGPLGEASGAVVQVELVAAPVADVEIDVAVVIEIARGDAGAVPVLVEARSVGGVAVRPILLAEVEAVGRAAAFRLARIDEEEIEASVAV